MRSAAWPSHFSGTRPARHLAPQIRIVRRRGSPPGRCRRSKFVPSSHVIGRSVLSRSVRHGTPSAVVSSCRPPESVSTSCVHVQAQHLEVAVRLGSHSPCGRGSGRAIAAEAEPLDHLPRPRMDREDERNPRATSARALTGSPATSSRRRRSTAGAASRRVAAPRSSPHCSAQCQLARQLPMLRAACRSSRCRRRRPCPAATPSARRFSSAPRSVVNRQSAELVGEAAG